jgi:hypothetical protein
LFSNCCKEEKKNLFLLSILGTLVGALCGRLIKDRLTREKRREVYEHMHCPSPGEAMPQEE